VQDHGPDHVLPRRLAVALLLVALVVILSLVLLNQFSETRSINPREQRAEMQIDDAIGATLEPLDSDTARSLAIQPRPGGLVVTSLSRTGPAAVAGIRTGDVIEQMDSKPVHSIKEAHAVVGRSRGKVTLTLNRHQHHARVKVQIPAEHKRREVSG
jgi:serine protease Do